MTEFNRQNLKKIDADIAEAVKAVGEKHGIDITVGGGSFTPSDATLKLTLKVEGADRASFERNAELVGLAPSDFGRRVSLNGVEYEIVGITVRARAYPINAKRVRDGKLFKLNEHVVKAGLSNVLNMPKKVS